jgi:uncharacterized protein YqeY
MSARKPNAGCHDGGMADTTTSDDVKTRLRTDLTAAMRARDTLRSGTIRMVLTAIKSDEVAGDRPRELSDEEVVTVLGREAKKRREAASAYDGAGRPELAEKERAELEVISGYLPQQLDDAEVAAIVERAVATATEQGATGKGAMGAVMKIVQPQVKGRADGGAVAAEVRRRLGM